MFEIGDLVTYAASGVCKISGTMENKVKGKKVNYLVLTPVYESSSKIYDNRPDNFSQEITDLNIKESTNIIIDSTVNPFKDISKKLC